MPVDAWAIVTATPRNGAARAFSGFENARVVPIKNKIMTFVRRTFVPKKVRRKIRKLWTMKERPELSPETTQYVESLFDQDLKTLGNKLGLELSCNNFKETVVSQKTISWT